MTTKPFEPGDPMELVGVPLPGSDAREMVLAILDEFVMLGLDEVDILRLFRSPHYSMTHQIWKSRGEEFVRDCLDEVGRRWCRPATSSTAGA